MDWNSWWKRYVKIDRETGIDEILPLLDEVNSDQEDGINNLINNSDTEFGLKKSLEN